MRSLLAALVLSTACIPFNLRAEAPPAKILDVQFNGPVATEIVKATISAIQAAKGDGTQVVILELNTPGGEIDPGFELSKAIEDSPVPVICVADNQAASMGFYILQSCALRVMTKRAVLMLHQPQFGQDLQGSAVEWQSRADMLKAMTQGMIEHLARRMKVSPAVIQARIQGPAQWWLAWEEALKVGAVDRVVPSVQDVRAHWAEMLPRRSP